jgi:hypothetical protein
MLAASTTRLLRRNACSSLTEERRDIAPSKAASPASSNRSRKPAGPTLRALRSPSDRTLLCKRSLFVTATLVSAGLSLTSLPNPHAAENDVIVRVHAAGNNAFRPCDRPGRRQGLLGRSGRHHRHGQHLLRQPQRIGWRCRCDHWREPGGANLPGSAGGSERHRRAGGKRRLHGRIHAVVLSRNLGL